MENQRVWIPDAEEGFILGRITDIGYDLVTAESFPPNAHVTTFALETLFIAEEYDDDDVDDNCALMYLNEATLLNNIRTRFMKDNIYTYCSNILIAVNPYVEIKDLYSSQTIKKYQGKSIGTMPPHVFAIADKAFRDMKTFNKSQSIIVSGESGSGKTESTKYILRYLCELWGSAAGPVEQKILDANPILEAFGNAKTTRNNNSSRFGKFVEVHFDSKYQVVGGHISHYLLEKSRVCVQSPEERNYHVFYLLCAGASDHLRRILEISNPDDFNYLRKGCRQYFTNVSSEKMLENKQKSEDHCTKGGLKDPILDDVNDFNSMDQALSRLGLSEENKLDIYSVVAAVLHLGNISFEERSEDTRGGCQVSPDSEDALVMTSTLLGVDKIELRQALTSKVMVTNRGGLKGTVIMVPLKIYEATSARDALAKALYCNLFDYIVKTINKSIPFKDSSYYVGVLDIAGFEYFTVNSFEQFCINYCNEKLQQFFNQRILKDEQELYLREGLNVPSVIFMDNQDCIELIETRGKGILALLDEECKLPKHSSSHFTLEVHHYWGSHFRLSLPRTSRLREHREMRDDEGFLVRHYAGAVCYRTEQFVEKNSNALHSSLEYVMQESKKPFVRGLFPMKTPFPHRAGRLTFDSVGLKFKTQLGELMDKLNDTGTHFIRCIKPNEKMIPRRFEGGNILSQLQSSGMMTVLELMQLGYPSRTVFSELYNMYRGFITRDLKGLDPRTFCKGLLHILDVKDKDYRFGITKLFFRSGKFAEFDRLMKSDPDSIRKMVTKVKKWHISYRWKGAQYCVLSVIKLKNKILYRRAILITLQKNIKMFLCMRKHQPRYKAIKKIKDLELTVKKMERIAMKVRADRHKNEDSLKELRINMLYAQQQIKMDEAMNEEQLNIIHYDLITKADRIMDSLQEKMVEQENIDEQERLKNIHLDIEWKRQCQEQEEMEKREEEDIKQRKVEMEMRRKAADEEQRLREERQRPTAEFIRKEEKKEEEQIKYQFEQDRRDHELALRLARENNSEIEDLSIPMTPELRRIHGRTPRGFDLTKWKYSELRDAINTSCDIALLEACRHEFHRRLKVYHAWKAKNKGKSALQSARVPQSVMAEANRAGTLGLLLPACEGRIDNAQRYFRIPFAKPSLANSAAEYSGSSTAKKGWWYAHFDGQYVARQMELHPDKEAILLVAGVDDMQMCELSLEETGLTRKKGAEILDYEFEEEWERQGGEPYFAAYQRAAQ